METIKFLAPVVLLIGKLVAGIVKVFSSKDEKKPHSPGINVKGNNNTVIIIQINLNQK